MVQHSEHKKMEELKRIISFCLLHKEDRNCSVKSIDRKPTCKESECNKGRIKRLHTVIKAKSVGINAVIGMEEE
jgi:hypothetical protein